MLNASVPLEQVVKSLERAMPTLGTAFRQAVHAGLKADKRLSDVLDECFAAIVGPVRPDTEDDPLYLLHGLTEKWNV